MLRVVEGVPGSGKTYYAVQYLNKFCTFDKVYNIYNVNSDVLLITNIDEIKVSHMSVDQFLSQSLYIVDKMKEYMTKNGYKKVVMIVDESQRYFSREALKNFPNENDLFYFFEYHRHLGVDIFLIVQTVSALHSRIVKLSEYIIRARQSSVSLPMVFLYDAIDSVTGDTLFSVKLKKDPEVFKLYKSFEFENLEKPKSILLKKWVVGISLFLIPIITAMIILKSGFLFGGMKKNKQSQVKQQQSVQVQQQQPVQQKGVPLNQFVQQQQSVQVQQQIQGKSIFPSTTHLLTKKAPTTGYQVQGVFCYDQDCYLYTVSSSYMQEKYSGKEEIFDKETENKDNKNNENNKDNKDNKDNEKENKENKQNGKQDKQNESATYFGKRTW